MIQGKEQEALKQKKMHRGNGELMEYLKEKTKGGTGFEKD